MQACDVIRAAIPGASDELCEHVVWGRTPFPFSGATKDQAIRILYRSASGFHRANVKGTRLCDHCERVTDGKSFICDRCRSSINRANSHVEADGLLG
jgi:hypothetical protein